MSWDLIRSNINRITKGDYKRYFDDGMCEVSISNGDDVTTNWTRWNDTDVDMDIAPRIYSDAYANNSLRLNIRVKGCT